MLVALTKHPLLLAASFASGFVAFLLLRPRAAHAQVPALSASQKTAAGTIGKSNPAAWNIRTGAPTLNDSPAAHAGNYVQHLQNISAAMATIEGGAETTEESEKVNQAFADLSIPMDVLTAQKDLNVLGASPPLVEDGVMGPKTHDAIDSFQKAMLISPQTGVMDAQTSNALRRAVYAAMQPSPNS